MKIYANCRWLGAHYPLVIEGKEIKMGYYQISDKNVLLIDEIAKSIGVEND